MKKNVIKNVLSYILIITGSFVTAISINLFLVPNKIAPGGVSGIATVFFHVFDFPVGIVMLLINIPLFIIGMKSVGSKFGLKTVIATILLSGFIEATTWIKPPTNDMMLSAVFAGAIGGIGLGLVIRGGATTGGTDLAARILHKYLPGFSIGNILLVIDFLVIIFASLVFNNYELMLYAIITLFLTTKFIDYIVEGADFAKAAYIISDKPDEIAKKIIKELDRGVTSLYGQGGYTHNEKKVLLCVIKRHEIVRLKTLTKEVDKNAFIIVNDVKEVLGEGFKQIP